jgi:hypothetical protein
MGVNLGSGSGIQQGVHVNFADIPGASIAIGLAGESIGSAGIIRGLLGQSRSRCYVGTGRTEYGLCEKQRRNKISESHFTLGRGGVPIAPDP